MADTGTVMASSVWAPRLQSVLRIVAAFMFVLSGTSKLFAFPEGMPPDGGTAKLMSQVGIGGILEVFGGGLMLVGLFTRPVAFVLSGMMAVAYFQFHAPQGLWPVVNNGPPAMTGVRQAAHRATMSWTESLWTIIAPRRT